MVNINCYTLLATVVILFVVVANCQLPTYTTPRPASTSCDRQNGLNDIICKKKRREAEELRINNWSREQIQFRVGQRQFRCNLPNGGRGAFLYSRYTLGAGNTTAIRLPYTPAGTCREAVITTCRAFNNRRQHCVTVLNAITKLIQK